MEKSKQELLVERKKRIADVIALKVPDRVPIWFQDAGFFPAKYGRHHQPGCHVRRGQAFRCL